MAEEKVVHTLDSLASRIDNMEGILSDMLDKLEAVAKDAETAKKTAASAGAKETKGLFGGKRKQTPMKDLLTGKIYISKAAVGKAFATEVGKPVTDTFAWYTVMTKLRMPKENKAGVAEGTDRFVPATEEEATKIKAEVAAQAEKDRQEMQEKLDAEEKARLDAEAKAAAQAAAPQKPAGAPQKPAGAPQKPAK